MDFEDRLLLNALHYNPVFHFVGQVGVLYLVASPRSSQEEVLPNLTRQVLVAPVVQTDHLHNLRVLQVISTKLEVVKQP